jgi:hypothetical protein
MHDDELKLLVLFLLFVEPRYEHTRRDEPNGLTFLQGQQVLITGHNDLGLPRHGRVNEHIILGVTADLHRPCQRDQLPTQGDERQQVVNALFAQMILLANTR